MNLIVFLLSLVAVAGACGMTAEQKRDAPPKTAIINANVWNGWRFEQNKTVVLLGGIICNAHPHGATIVDAKGGYLIPGLIDTHCHITSCSYLTTLRQYGITTALDMGTYPYSSVTACRAAGVTDVYGSGAAATVNGTTISHLPGFPSDSFVPDVAAGRKFVADRVAEGVDYIKVILDPMGPSNETLAAIVQAAHEAERQVITHAPSYADYSQAEAARADLPCHAPLDKPLDTASVSKLRVSGVHVTPTLIMMQSIVNNTHQPYAHYTTNAAGSVTSMYKGGVPILAGSDANHSPLVPANPPFGISLHEELELLVAAGVSPVDAIRSATSLAASSYRLYDRGTIHRGLRADLVLLSADPTVDIRNSRSIQRVWVHGVETEPSS